MEGGEGVQLMQKLVEVEREIKNIIEDVCTTYMWDMIHHFGLVVAYWLSYSPLIVH